MNERTWESTLKYRLRRVVTAALIGTLLIAAVATVLVAAQGRSVAEDPSTIPGDPVGIADSGAATVSPPWGARAAATDPGAHDGARSLAIAPDVGVGVAAGPAVGTAVLVSINSAGTDSGGGDSQQAAISANGRYVAFRSLANDLVPTDTNHEADVFRRDLVAGTVTLLSVNSAGTDSGNGASKKPSMSRDGRYVAFVSDASDLVATDTNGRMDVFVRDVTAGTTTLVSVNSAGTDSGNDDSTQVVISADGRYVAFESYASDLVTEDTDFTEDVFVRDLVAGTTVLVSVDVAGTDSGNSYSFLGAISASGRYVAFESNASDLVVTDTNGTRDVFVRDLVAGATTLVSVNSTGTNSGNGQSSSVVVSANGRYAAFQSLATNLAITDTNGTYDVFVRDIVVGTTTMVSMNSAGTRSGNGRSQDAAISADGRHVAFVSEASNLVVPFTDINLDVFVRDLVAGTTTLVSVQSGGGDSANADSVDPVISADGRCVAFSTRASNLVAINDTNSDPDIFLRDVVAGTTTMASVNRDGTASGNRESEVPVISAGGRVVAFESLATDLVVTDTNGKRDVFAFDQAWGTIVIAKEAAPADGTDFGFTSDVPGSGSFSLDDLEPVNSDDGITDTLIIRNVLPGVYTVTEQTLGANWVLWDVSCVDPTSDSSGDTGSRTATIELAPFETITCTFRNAQTASISLRDRTLLVMGSDAREKIDVRRVSVGPVVIEASIEDLDTSLTVMDTFGREFDRVVIYGLGADDEIRMYANVGSTPAELYGGAGDDVLIGGRANDVLVGGTGDDRLLAGLGRDILIGGADADEGLSGDGHDILVGGEYTDQENPTANRALMSEWSRIDLGYVERVNNLQLGGGLNGAYVLSNDTVADPTAGLGHNDDLSGELGRDWFVASAGDVMDRQVTTEVLTGVCG